MKSVMEHSFSQVPQAEIQRSSFDRSHGLKTTFDSDWLIPVLVDLVGPGDTFNVTGNFFARLATPIHPLMDNMYLDTFYFFVPNRLLWVNWEKFLGAQDDPGDSIDFTVPIMTSHTPALGSLSDYMGLPTRGKAVAGASALPFRAVNKIWTDWFRDQNLQVSPVLDTGDANSIVAEHVLLKRGKRHDYFTSSLPSPQKGAAVSLPLGGTAPILGLAVPDAQGDSGGHVNLTDSVGSGKTYATDYWVDALSDVYIESQTAGGLLNIRADMSAITGATINDLRLAIQTQKLLERDARSGTRINETIKAHWGVTVPDFRVQRSEYLGGGSQPIGITPVPNTSDTAGANQGDLAGFGTVAGGSGFTKSFTEHGVIIGFANVRSDITYSQGLERMWSKATRYDFMYPVLAQIGEQAVKNKEVYLNADANDDLTWGYQERYSEDRYKPSRLSGLMRPDAAGTLAAWHLSEDFAVLPTLGATFIQSNTGVPLDRAIAVPTEPHLIADFHFNMKCARPMPLYGVPGNMDRF